jgi:maleylacetoacetate isomerase/maleylpyruvate isomerase
MKLFTFWRSMAAWRVRIALNLKGLKADSVYVDLDAGAQRDGAYREVNPQMALPALIDGEGPALFQSLAIVEYLDEVHPEPPLLPADPRGRARVRGLAMILASDSHPLLVPRVRAYLERELKLSEEQRQQWARHWVIDGLTAVEAHLARDRETGRFCHGGAPTLADICLVGHVGVARWLNCDLAALPTATRIAAACGALPAFAQAHPQAQADAPKSVRPA